jgi:signal transduction histidine kinase/ActR/RegA family two-component response regulator
MKSLRRQIPALLFAVSALSLSIVVVAVTLWWNGMRLDAFIAQETEIVRERTLRERERFAPVMLIERSILAEHEQIDSDLDQAQANDIFAAAMVEHADGTWRSRDYLFDGGDLTGIGRVYGMAVYMPEGELTEERKRLVAGAILTLTESGRHFSSWFTSMWFISQSGDVVIFAPNREDRLTFYRQTAGPALNVRELNFYRSVLPEENPEGRITCTGHEKATWDEKGQTLVSSCQVAAVFNGRFGGAWGTTITISPQLRALAEESNDTTDVLLITDSGGILVAPGLAKHGDLTPFEARALEKRYHLAETLEAIKATRQSSGVLPPHHHDQIVSFARFGEPGWTLLFYHDARRIGQPLWPLLLLSLALCGVLIAFQMFIIGRFAQQHILEPLRKLSWQYVTTDGKQMPVDTSEDLPAEIEELAESLRSAWRENLNLVANLETRVAERTQELERANRAKDVFLANMSHEIRTPLNGVIGLVDILARSELSPAQKEMIDLVRSSSGMLERILTDILDLSKLEAGRFELSYAPFDLVETIESAAHLLRVRADDKGVSFVTRFDETARGLLVGDAVRIRQILSNLISNAIKFTDLGEVVMEVCVEGGTERDDRVFLEVCVHDTGIGFDAEMGERLFSRFEQADQSVTRRFGGSGLGLAISRALADAMGGNIDARSTPGKGSTFTFRLPLQRTISLADYDIRTNCEEEYCDDYLMSSENLRILLAEDHPTNQRVVRLILEPLGIKLTVTPNGLEALSAFRQSAFDCVLMDMQMPEMDGLTATEQMRALEKRKDRRRTPIAMLSANAMSHHKQAALEAGVDIHIAKPVTPQGLIDGIMECMRLAEDHHASGKGAAKGA